MSGFVHSCELKGLWLLAQRLTNVSLYKYREFLLKNSVVLFNFLSFKR
jgi:hypothetical protein